MEGSLGREARGRGEGGRGKTWMQSIISQVKARPFQRVEGQLARQLLASTTSKQQHEGEHPTYSKLLPPLCPNTGPWQAGKGRISCQKGYFGGKGGGSERASE